MTGLPISAKRGASSMTMRRSQSSGVPVCNRCTGAGAVAGSAAPSCASPSLRTRTPDSRFAGSSAMARDSAAPSRVPSSASPRAMRRISVPGHWPSCSSIRAMAASACSRRPGSVWLALRSSTSRTISDRGRAVPRSRPGPASAAAIRPSASPRHHAPRSPRQSATASASTASTATSAASHAAACQPISGARIGSKTSPPQLMADPPAAGVPAGPAHGSGRICSSRSAHT